MLRRKRKQKGGGYENNHRSHRKNPKKDGGSFGNPNCALLLLFDFNQHLTKSKTKFFKNDLIVFKLETMKIFFSTSFPCMLTNKRNLDSEYGLLRIKFKV